MKDRGFFAWMMICTALLFFWMSMRQRQFQEEKRIKDEAAAVESEKIAGALKPKAEANPEIGPLEVDAVPPPTESLPSFWYIGSMNKADNYNLGIALTSQGAGIDRIELVEQTTPGKYRYKLLPGRGGYMGHLALIEESSGLRIRLIPFGSPASHAASKSSGVSNGMLANDLVVSANGQTSLSLDAWTEILEKINPGQTVNLEVERPLDGGQSTRIGFEVTLTEAPLDAVRVADDSITEQVIGNILRSSCLTTLSKVDASVILNGSRSIRGLEKTLQGHWAARALPLNQGMGVEFSMPLDGWLKEAGISAKLELVKAYRVMPVEAANGQPKPNSMGYDLELETTIRNTDTKAHDVGFRQEGLNGATLEGWWYSTKVSQYFYAAGARDIVYYPETGHHTLVTRSTLFKTTQSNPKAPDELFVSGSSPTGRSLRYIGIDTQYFTAAMLPHPDSPDALKNLELAGARAICDTSKIPSAKQQASNVGFWFDTASVKLEPGEAYTKKYRIFAGPKDPAILAAYGLDDCLEYGWAIIGVVAKPLSWVLHGFYAIVRNYGIAIIMLTVLVRGGMFPLGRRAALNAQKMQELAPEIKRITEQYKDDFEKRTAATKEIYAKHNFKPLAGCMPVFIQLPIFLGLYRALSVDIELRQQPLIPGVEWCSNLAGPDMMADWSSILPDMLAGRGTGWLGPYFNILPLVTITLFIIQQKVLMPKATDEQTRMTQNMMMYMTVFMGVMFFKVPSGLCIYFVTSSIWSLIERSLVKRWAPPPRAIGALAGGAPIKPDKIAPLPPDRVKMKAVKAPEKLSDIIPWLKSQSQGKDVAKASDASGTIRNRPKRTPKK